MKMHFKLVLTFFSLMISLSCLAWERVDYLLRFEYFNTYSFRTLEYSIEKSDKRFIIRGTIDGGRRTSTPVEDLSFDIEVNDPELESSLISLFAGDLTFYGRLMSQLDRYTDPKHDRQILVTNPDYQASPNDPKIGDVIDVVHYSKVFGSNGLETDLYSRIEAYIKVRLKLQWN
jgi:hypothetical protein